MSPSYMLPIVASVAMHIMLLVAVTWGWQASSDSTKIYTPRYVEAKLVQLKPSRAKKVAKKPKANKIDLTAKRRVQEKKRQEEKKRRQAKKAAAETAKKEKQRKQKEAERQEKERQEKERQEKQRQQLAIETEMASELQQEESMLQEQEYSTLAQSYSGLIAAKIEQNWSRPPSARKGMQCELTLRIVPTGQVVNVTITKSSGNAAFDRSAEQAVKKVERFPELQKVPPALFESKFRQFTLVFNPRDLRQ